MELILEEVAAAAEAFPRGGPQHPGLRLERGAQKARGLGALATMENGENSDGNEGKHGKL